MAGGRIITVRRGAIGELRIDNPGKFNAMSLGMWHELAARTREFAAESDVRVVLLRGEGERAFVSGADITEFDTKRSAASGSRDYDAAVEDAQHALMACPHPVVASIRGVCMGGGLGLAMACDLRYGAMDTRFRMPAARLGLGYSFRGVEHMVHGLGAPRVAELFFTARTFDGAEALRMGLLQAAFGPDELDARIEEILSQIAANAPLTIRLAKRSIALARRLAPEADNAEIERLRVACVESEDYAEGRRAFAQKRAPRFTGQ
jgi:enoyl-CoA hydratase/carnithine racemase